MQRFFFLEVFCQRFGRDIDESDERHLCNLVCVFAFSLFPVTKFLLRAFLVSPKMFWEVFDLPRT
jgi:hypothetical protein